MKKAFSEDKLAHAALVLIGKKGWAGCTPAALAKSAKAPLPAAQQFLESPCNALRALAAYISRLTLRDYQHDTAVSPRDALFELMMLRFDVLQQYRAGMRVLLAAAIQQPPLAAALFAALPEQMNAMLDAADIKPRTPLHTLGLCGIYTATLWVWQRDMSADLDRTMAALDGHLRRTEALLNRLSR